MDDKTKQPFYINPDSNEPQWNDPRKPIEPPTTATNVSSNATAGGKVTMAMVAVIPVILLIVGAASRICYLHVSGSQAGHACSRPRTDVGSE